MGLTRPTVLSLMPSKQRNSIFSMIKLINYGPETPRIELKPDCTRQHTQLAFRVEYYMQRETDRTHIQVIYIYIYIYIYMRVRDPKD
jgi:hypothetical protein